MSSTALVFAPSSLTEERILTPSPLKGEGRGGGENLEHKPQVFTALTSLPTSLRQGGRSHISASPSEPAHP
jgi:hypothetical protein